MKVLVIRFSSFGDILQCLGAICELKRQFPKAQVHWVTREDFGSLLESAPAVDKVWRFSRKNGLLGLLHLARELRREGYTHVYDAHNNLRSHILSALISRKNFVRRPKNRFKRFLLFRLRINRFRTPFRAQISFIEPLQKWGVQPRSNVTGSSQNLKFAGLPQKFKDLLPTGLKLGENSFQYVVFAPSAAWELKRWPVEHWKKLLSFFEKVPVVLLGGAEDLFIHELAGKNSGLVIDCAGQLSLSESSAVVAHSALTISADTGFLHLADLLGIPLVALIGPTAFGYPSSPSSRVEEIELPCKPCSKDGRGKCTHAIFKKCLTGIEPARVFKTAETFLKTLSKTDSAEIKKSSDTPLL